MFAIESRAAVKGLIAQKLYLTAAEERVKKPQIVIETPKSSGSRPEDDACADRYSFRRCGDHRCRQCMNTNVKTVQPQDGGHYGQPATALSANINPSYVYYHKSRRSRILQVQLPLYIGRVES